MAPNRGPKVDILLPEETMTALRDGTSRKESWLFAEARNTYTGNRVWFKFRVLSAVSLRNPRGDKLECVVSRPSPKCSVWLADVFSCAERYEGSDDMVRCILLLRGYSSRYELAEGTMHALLDRELARQPLGCR